MESIGELIKRERLRAGVSQASLAWRAGTSQAAISRIERGLEQPGPDRVEAILTSLGLRLRLELEPLAEHDAEPRRLLEQARKTPEERFAEGLAWDRFMARIDEAAKVAP
jgi:transcriptional regulator with XRE-family HTH domain